MSFYSASELTCLRSEGLLKLFREVDSYAQGIKIEVLANRRSHHVGEEHPATTVGLTLQAPLIRIVDSLGKEQKVEAIAHELAHLLLVYRHGLGVVGRRIPRHGDSEDVFRFYMSMGGEWVYLLGQIANTAHHLLLIDYLKGEYGIEDSLHIYLLNQNFCVAANKNARDKESQYGMGLVAFEYEKFIGRVDRVINIHRQTEFFWKAYHSAQKHFDKYSFRSIPAPSSYQEDILSLLEDLGYQKGDFVFFPEGKRDFCPNILNLCKRKGGIV